MPACHETVTWIILNKPSYITKPQLTALRDITKTNSTAHGPPPTLANNYRPTQKLHHRPVRTNIDFSNAVSEKKGVLSPLTSPDLIEFYETQGYMEWVFSSP
ncbi:Carbonic anhydrase-related protein 10 [Halocaridina rubra]|uniref:Carbonic anhydrase-related protein 10 n=1 Tax=Halocaridina rubra TaxID=373956 RepID=A0AAN8X5A6_HALRR